MPALRKLVTEPLEDKDTFIRTMIGGFGQVCHKVTVALCCSPLGNMALFYAWDGTVRHSDGVVRVNLLLNRASPWLDVDSYLPYEGKVLLHNKTAREAFVRVPLWVEREEVQCEVDGRDIENTWDGNYLRFPALAPGQDIVIRFPMRERTERWTNPTEWGQGGLAGAPVGTVFEFRFRGNTLVEVTPPFVPDDPNPVYGGRAEKYHTDVAPMVRRTRFVTNKVLRW